MRRLNKPQRAFLAAFAACGQITKAAKEVDLDRSAHYEWLAAGGSYTAAFAAAQEQAAQTLEDEAVRRAHEGITQAEWYQGKPVGAKRVYSDGLLMFLLRGLRPDKYRQNVNAELTGAGGGAIEVSLAELIRDRRARREAAATPPA